MHPQVEIAKLINYIEENLRTTTKTQTTFIDPQGFLDRLKTKQNHVVFGRRGAGKSLLTTSLLKDDSTNVIYINLEDFKDISFPNIIIRVLSKLIDELRMLTKQKTNWFNLKAFRFCRNLAKEKRKIDKLISEPDQVQKDIRTREESSAKLKARMQNVASGVEGQVGVKTEEEIQKSIVENKLDELRKELTSYKSYFIVDPKIQTASLVRWRCNLNGGTAWGRSGFDTVPSLKARSRWKPCRD